MLVKIEGQKSCSKLRVYLYFYTDSVGFPRMDTQRPEDSWPFIIKNLLEQNHEIIAYPYIRGLGGATIGEITKIYNRDKGYFKAQDGDSISFVIFNIGVVDASPRPFTHVLKNLAKIPRIGTYLWYIAFKIVQPHRRILQRIYSYRLTSPRSFKYLFNKMVSHAISVGMVPISIETPLMPDKFEIRSPGLNNSIRHYNLLKRTNEMLLHIETSWITERELTEDGHHLNKLGNIELGNKLANFIGKQIECRKNNL